MRATATTSAPEDIAADRDDAPDVVSAATVPFACLVGLDRLAHWQLGNAYPEASLWP